MFPLYKKYRWQGGKPVGIDQDPKGHFRLLSDPYGKRHIIEEYENGRFIRVIYDSTLFDFRHLHERHQVGWSKEWLKENRLLIRDREHIPLFIEEHVFKEGKAVFCTLSTPHGIVFGEQKISYEAFGDPFNGVVLFDISGEQVLKKIYSLDDVGEFKEVKEKQF
jgi:hypothetical protein